MELNNYGSLYGTSEFNMDLEESIQEQLALQLMLDAGLTEEDLI